MSTGEFDTRGGGSNPWGKIWERGMEEYSDDKESKDESLERKREDLAEVVVALRDKVREQIGDIEAGDDGDSIGYRLADGCWESADGDGDERRAKCLAEAREVQDMMLLEEARVWLPEGSEAEARLTELFHNTYCADNDEMAGLSEYVTETNDDGELPKRVREIEENEGIESKILMYKGKEEDDDANDSIDTRRKDFVAFARICLGKNSEEYQLIASEAYRSGPGHFTDSDLDKPYQPGSDFDKFQKYMGDIENRAPLTDYMTQLGGKEVPLRVAASLMDPFSLN